MADKPLIFLIHGMGVHKRGWSRSVKTALNSHAQEYKYFKTDRNGAELSTLVDFAEITYDNVFRKALENWQQNNAALLQEVAPEDREEAEKAVSWMEGMSETENNFAWHAVYQCARVQRF